MNIQDRTRPFATRLTGGFALVLLVAVSCATFVLLELDQRRATMGLEASAVRDATRVARAVAPALDRASRRRPGSLARRLAGLRRANPHVRGVAVHQGRTLLASVGSQPDRAVAGALRAAAERRDRIASRAAPAGDPRGLAVVLPPARDVRTSVTLLYAVPAVGRSRLAAVLIAIAAGLASALMGTLLVDRWLARPLRRMTGAVKAMALGGAGTALTTASGGALGELGREVHAALASLEQRGRSLEGLALEDPLTGLANQRAFLERLDAELRRARREYYRVAVVALDIDHFKSVNDSFGHAVGDDALRLLSQAVAEQLRAGDLCGRIGGDEFVVALARADSAGACQVMERVSAAVAAVTFGPAGQRLTLSAGVAEFPLHATDRAELMSRADTALYQAKRSGRDRCSVYRSVERVTPMPGDEHRRKIAVARAVRALVLAVDAKDDYTHEHSQRVAVYAAALASRLGLAPAEVELVRTAGVVHDVGKLGVQTALLLKPGMLSQRERDLVRGHSEFGRDIIAAAGLGDLGTWVRHLHERYDGEGYPDGLAGQDIPLESRILHVAEALESMTSPPPHRTAKPLRVALGELEAGAGLQFDPRAALAMVDLVESGELEVGDQVVLPDVFRNLSVPASAVVTPRAYLARQRG